MSSVEQVLIESSSLQQATALNGLQWYAVQTRARHEKRIGADLEQRGILSFVPTVKEAHRWSDRTKIVEVPLFSCYVFVRIAPDPAQQLEVLKTVGVFRFVKVSGEPAIIPNYQIESLQTVLTNQLPVSVLGNLKLGQKVRIRGGVLDGVQGVLTAVRGMQKLVLSVDLIHQAVAVTVDGYLVEPV